MKSLKSYWFYVGMAFILLSGAGFYVIKIAALKNFPTSFILEVPFSAQAPTNNWSRNEDCEETSLVMVKAFLDGNLEKKLSAPLTQESINYLKTWEQANLGYNADTGAGATTRMAREAFGLKVKEIKDYTEANLKTELLKGQPILLPINAKLLNSPQYLKDGPTYHMIVVRGFRGHTFIVNDPGTDNGEGNEYSFSVLQKASADWNNATKKMEANRKIALIISK
ncbi:MAG: C39 family peptidase [bacterium]|nr:C39 family peptidase [bacterium]